MRGFGVTQIGFAYEVHMDTIAAEIGMDPVEFRILFQPEASAPRRFRSRLATTRPESSPAAQRAAQAIIAPTDGSNPWHKDWPLRDSIATRRGRDG